MTLNLTICVMPAKAGISGLFARLHETPAFAGVTVYNSKQCNYVLDMRRQAQHVGSI